MNGIARAGLLLFAVAAVAVVVWNLVPQSPGMATSPAAPPPSFPPDQTVTPPTDAGSAANANPPATDLRDYAIAIEELQGFPPDASPGTEFELWVTWDRSPTRAPRLHKLTSDATLARVVPPITPGGPSAAVLSVPAGKIPDLLYADGFGSLSVTVLPY